MKSWGEVQMTKVSPVLGHPHSVRQPHRQSVIPSGPRDSSGSGLGAFCIGWRESQGLKCGASALPIPLSGSRCRLV